MGLPYLILNFHIRCIAVVHTYGNALVDARILATCILMPGPHTTLHLTGRERSTDICHSHSATSMHAHWQQMLKAPGMVSLTPFSIL
jgi:hypothetical protein